MNVNFLHTNQNNKKEGPILELVIGESKIGKTYAINKYFE